MDENAQDEASAAVDAPPVVDETPPVFASLADETAVTRGYTVTNEFGCVVANTPVTLINGFVLISDLNGEVQVPIGLTIGEA